MRLNFYSTLIADGLTQIAVSDYNDIAERMASGTEARTVAATAMNATRYVYDELVIIMLTDWV